MWRPLAIAGSSLLPTQVNYARVMVVGHELWQEIQHFDENSIATVGKRESELETEYVSSFLQKISIQNLFEALGDASSAGENSKVGSSFRTRELLPQH